MKTIIPQHIGIILDGNRRWAQERNLDIFRGHKAGFENLKKVANHAFEKGVKILTVFAFSTENWKRTKREVNYLMNLFKIFVEEEIIELKKRGVQLRILGEIDKFDKKLKEGIIKGTKLTKNGKKGTLNVCLNYGGREELLIAIKNIIKDKVPQKKINDKLINKYLYTKNQVDPELIIRTSGELRLSGFLTWQGVYSELYFPQKHWPDFKNKDLDKAILEYNKRKRRFGGN